MTTHRYIGEGRHHVGIPARDLTRDDLARLPGRLRQRLEASGLYVPVTRKPKQPKEPQDV